MVTGIIGTNAEKARLNPARAARPGWVGGRGWSLSVAVLARQAPLQRLADERQVSRKFLYRQADKAERALQEAFAPADEADEVLYSLPVSKRWIQQFVLAAALLGHSSYRGIVEMAGDLFDYHDLSLGTAHNILGQACTQARTLSRQEDLSAVRVGAHDEIYQAGRPVLVGVDAHSTYCYLLAEAEHCDETTWGVHLLELSEKGLRPQYTVADGGTALRAGPRAAWKDVPCHGDVFHGERELSTLAGQFTRRAAGGCPGAAVGRGYPAAGRLAAAGHLIVGGTRSGHAAGTVRLRAGAVPAAGAVEPTADCARAAVVAAAAG